MRFGPTRTFVPIVRRMALQQVPDFRYLEMDAGAVRECPIVWKDAKQRTMRVARVFPRRTRATPVDDLAFTDAPGLFPPEVDAVHISVTFTWDRQRAEQLAREWDRVAPVTIGGPGWGTRGEEFTPGMYLKPGYTITSRGCDRCCWFCDAWRRDGTTTRELKIRAGWNVLDDNLLATSPQHFKRVLRMLRRLKRRAEFTGGLEAARLTDWHIDALASLQPRPICFFAYDTPSDYEPLLHAGRRMMDAGFTRASHNLRCYVLCGWRRDTMDAAATRMRQAWDAGFFPMAMLYRDEQGLRDPAWRTFQRHWARPAIVVALLAGG